MAINDFRIGNCGKIGFNAPDHIVLKQAADFRAQPAKRFCICRQSLLLKAANGQIQYRQIVRSH